MPECTPGPWEVSSDGCHINAEGVAGSIAVTYGPEPDREEDARRIVACVNACEGMDDPAAEIAHLRFEVERLKGFETMIHDLARKLYQMGVTIT